MARRGTCAPACTPKLSSGALGGAASQQLSHQQPADLALDKHPRDLSGPLARRKLPPPLACDRGTRDAEEQAV
jgi:hypothetical protein